MEINIHPKFVLDEKGDKEFALLSFGEFKKMCEIIEDYNDLIDLRKAEQESDGKTLTFDEIKKKYKYSIEKSTLKEDE